MQPFSRLRGVEHHRRRLLSHRGRGEVGLLRKHLRRVAVEEDFNSLNG